MDIKALILALNTQRATEYAAAIQYYQHRAMLTGNEVAFQDMLDEHASDELKHAGMLLNQITYLGGVVSVDIAKIYTASDSIQMLRQDKQTEQEAIEAYTALYGMCMELQQFGTANVILDILQDENEHYNDLQSILKI